MDDAERVRGFKSPCKLAAILGFSIGWEPEHGSVANNGDVDYMIEHNRVTITDATGAVQVQYGKLLPCGARIRTAPGGVRLTPGMRTRRNECFLSARNVFVLNTNLL